MPKKKTNMAALPHYPEFNHETKNKAAKWTKYVNRLRNYFTAYNIEDDKRKKAMVLTFVGGEVNDIIDELPSEQTTPEKNETHFDKLILDSISTTSVIPRLDKIFAEFGVPVSLKTDNGPPFNSHEFKTYASITGFRHRRITPLWPQANGETERFMRTVKKSIKAALNKRRSWKQELFKFLLDYRTTPHCTTGAPPATILFGRTIKNRLPHLITPIAEDPSIRERDTEAKRKIKQYADRKAYVKPNDLRVGDTVIVKSDNTSKALTPYQPNPMTIIKKKGSMITATHKGSQTTRNSSFFKKIPKPTTNHAHNLLDYPSSEDESYTHTTTPPEYKDNQTQHTTLNLRRSSRTKRPPKRFDHEQKKKIIINIPVHNSLNHHHFLFSHSG